MTKDLSPMTTKQLEALLIDQTLGELSEEASALLEAYLVHFPERRDEADQVRRAIALTETAVLSHPLVREAEPDPVTIPFPVSGSFSRGLLRAAAAVALLGLALATGFFAGKESVESASSVESVTGSGAATAPSPWARYRFEDNGRLAVTLPSDPNS